MVYKQAKHNPSERKRQYDALFEKQGGVCAICKEPPQDSFKSPLMRKLHLDHNHNSGDTRSLLCMRCNRLLANVENNRTLYAAMTEYLDEHSLTS